jgi:hypothetical protein
MLLRYSEADSLRFGRRIHRAFCESAPSVADVVKAARREEVEMVIARCSAGSPLVAQELERQGFKLMDTLVYYLGKTVAFTDPWPVPGVELRPLQSHDLPSLEAIANECFTNYDGHYHNDVRLDATAATAGYVDRFRQSIKDPTISTFVADLGQRPVGFLTLRRGGADGAPADIDLNAVALDLQRRGIYRSLFRAAGIAARLAGDALLTISTNLSNVAPQKVWAREGLEMHRALHTFHGWVDEMKEP